jgi:ATP-dependent RNA helicase DDX10/DBP4
MNFSDLPLSQPTAAGLDKSHFKRLTDIQSKSIPLALEGKDILGAAKTGSGKTLAFLVPVLENLYRQKWTPLDGLGALIISPTRELAEQIFLVLRKIGRYHEFSAGVIVGGTDYRTQQGQIGRMNILIGTPGRILQHLDQTVGFKVDTLQMLVMDEADRCMDMGFQSTVDAIVHHLPKRRQTMLFSATQTRKVSDLARLSLKDMEYVAVHEAAASATPTTLKQYYIVTPLPDKLDTLYSFIKSNLKAKIIVFLSSCKQVRFVYEGFRHLQPGIPLMHLHGRQKPATRRDITSKFSSSTTACIFSTDIMARGLDFPTVDWVIQLDCPEDADTYIHRVGRTARYEKAGSAVLFLDPSEEEGMLKRLEHKKVPIKMTKPRSKKQQSVKDQLVNMCFQDPELKYLGQKAFVSYTKSLYIQKDKEVFNLNNYDLEGFAASMGLPGAPKIKFQKGDDGKKIKNTPRALLSNDEESDAEAEGKKSKKSEVRTKYDRMFERRNQDVLSGHYSKMIADDEPEKADDGLVDADVDDEFLSAKRVLPMVAKRSEDEKATAGPEAKVIPGIGREPIVIDSKRKEKMLKSKKKLLKLKEKGRHLRFDNEGKAHQVYELEDEKDFQRRGPVEEQRAKFLAEETARVKEADLDDKQLVKKKKKEKREKRKAREMAGDGEAAPDLGDTGEDPMALLKSLPLAEDKEGDEQAPAAKRRKNWFEDDSEEERKAPKKNRRLIEAEDEPETLEDLESLAAGLLK